MTCRPCYDEEFEKSQVKYDFLCVLKKNDLICGLNKYVGW